MTYIVATAPGGGYDTYGRLVADFMQKHLPGSTFVVRNMPGAGHLVGTNAINASKPDGLTIGTFNTGLIYNQLINADGVRFDLSKMSWIGKAASESRVVAIASQSPIKTWQDFVALKEPVNFAVAGPAALPTSKPSCWRTCSNCPCAFRPVTTAQTINWPCAAARSSAPSPRARPMISL